MTRVLGKDHSELGERATDETSTSKVVRDEYVLARSLFSVAWMSRETSHDEFTKRLGDLGVAGARLAAVAIKDPDILHGLFGDGAGRVVSDAAHRSSTTE